MSKSKGTNTEVVKVRAGGRDSDQIEVHYDVGRSLDELTTQFGDVIVAAKAREKIIINLQDYLRNNAKKGVEGADLQALADKWVPGMRAPGASKAEKAKSAFEALSPEDRAAVLASLQA